VSTTTRIEVAAGPSGAHVLLSHGLLQARRLRSAPGSVRVALVGAQALLLAGDRVRVEVSVSGRVRVELVEVAGTVAYNMRGGSAAWDCHVELAGGADLSWRGEPFVVSQGASVARSTTLAVTDESCLELRESFVLGRTGEHGGTLRTTTRGTLGGRPAIAEDLDLAPHRRRGWAVLGDHRCLDSLTLLGRRAPDDLPGVLQLEEHGSLLRWLGNDLHHSPLAGLRSVGV
jgi:urease accessory protein